MCKLQEEPATGGLDVRPINGIETLVISLVNVGAWLLVLVVFHTRLRTANAARLKVSMTSFAAGTALSVLICALAGTASAERPALARMLACLIALVSLAFFFLISVIVCARLSGRESAAWLVLIRRAFTRVPSPSSGRPELRE